MKKILLKLLELTFGALVVIGFVTILCTAGLSDNDALEWGEIVTRCVEGGALMLVGYFGAYVSGAGFIE